MCLPAGERPPSASSNTPVISLRIGSAAAAAVPLPEVTLHLLLLFEYAAASDDAVVVVARISGAEMDSTSGARDTILGSLTAVLKALSTDCAMVVNSASTSAQEVAPCATAAAQNSAIEEIKIAKIKLRINSFEQQDNGMAITTVGSKYSSHIIP